MLSLLLRWCLLPVQYYEDEQNKAHRCYTVLTILLQCDVVHHCYAGLAILKCHDLYTVNHCSAVLAMLLECGELDTVHCLNVMSLIQFTVWMLWSWYSSLFECGELDVFITVIMSLQSTLTDLVINMQEENDVTVCKNCG